MYHLIIRHEGRPGRERAILDLFQNYPSVKSVGRLLEGSARRDWLIEIRFGDEGEARAAAEEFENRIDWEWNVGFGAKVNGLRALYSRDKVHIDASWDNWGLKNFPEFLGESMGDDLAAIGPGYFFRLPAYNKRKLTLRLIEG